TLPDQHGNLTYDPGGPQTTLLLSAEDALAHTVRPRLDAMEADPARIHILQGWIGPEDEVHTFTLQHMEPLVNAIEQVRPRLVVIDPIQAYLGHIDMNKANQTRPLMMALANIAERYRCAMLCVRHPAKAGGQGGGKAIYRGLGSIDM